MTQLLANTEAGNKYLCNQSNITAIDSFIERVRR